MSALTNQMDTCLITGASSGIGLALCKQILDQGRDHVIAVSRSAEQSPPLAELQVAYPERLTTKNCDITDEQQRQNLQQLAPAGHLRRVINCAGLLHDDSQNLWPEKRIENLSAEALTASFSVNAFAPVLLARDLLPLMPKDKPSVFSSISARVGSISDNGLGGWYSYRAAKAAQNQLLKTLAIEMRRRRPQLCILLLHPGTTDTALSAPFQRNVKPEKLFTSDYVARQLLSLMDAAGSEDSGRFLAWNGEDIPW